MKKRVSFITACLMILLVQTGLTSAFAKPLLEQIQFENPGPNEDRIIFKLNGAHLPTSFALKGDRPRVVFDFPEVVPTKKVKNTIQADGTFIKSIRTGVHRGNKPKTRIVFDLKPGMLVDFDQNFDEETNTLLIRVSAAGMTLEPITVERDGPEAMPEEKIEHAETKAEPVGEKPIPAVSESATLQETPPEPDQIIEKTPPVEPIAVTEPKHEEPEPVTQKEEEAALPEPTQTASVPAADTEEMAEPGIEESTVIQPLSEVGETEKEAAEKVMPTLFSVEFDDTSHRGEIVAFKLNSFNPPVVFGIEEDIPRIVCFFKDTSAANELEEIIESGGRFIKSIKVGKYRDPDNIRVVLDLVPGKNYDLQQIFFKEDSLFMIIINTTGEKVVN